MTKEEMLRIAKEEKERYLFLKKSCDTCVPNELIEWINEVIKRIENEEKIKTNLEILYRKKGLPCEHDTFNANSCMDCKSGKESRCDVYMAYRAILDLI